jgi:hypothetical protein
MSKGSQSYVLEAFAFMTVCILTALYILQNSQVVAVQFSHD